MNIKDSHSHVRGESIYVDDMLEIENTLHAVLFTSPYPHGTITKLDCTEALQSEGVFAILTAKDIPGENQIGGIIRDEELLTSNEFHYENQPLAMILANTELNGRKARAKIILEYKELEVVTDPREAKEKGFLISKPRTFALGSPELTWAKCKYINIISNREKIYKKNYKVLQSFYNSFL